MSAPANMSGPDHYREAERLLQEAAEQSWDTPTVAKALAARAQVHATLAHVAVTLDTHTSPAAHAGRGEREWLRLLRPYAVTEGAP